MTMHRRIALMAAAALLVATLPAGAASGSDAFDRIKGLVGTWEGKNTKGDKVELRYELVADGTAVLEHLNIAGEKNHHNMATMFHMDGDELILTHYCAAGNQPRMVARDIEGSKVGFRFLDATGLKSNDEGHMHRAVFTFEGDDRMKADWTWREGGEDRFTETVRVRRVSDTARR